MPKWMIYVGAAAAGLAGLLLVAYLGAGAAADARMSQTWPDVKGKDLPIPFPLTADEIDEIRAERAASQEVPIEEIELAPEEADAIALERAIERGTRLANSQLACVECHQGQGEGGLVADAMPVMMFYAPNITPATRVADFTSADWDRLLRHGVMPDGQSSIMPAIDYQRLADRDVSDVAAWAASLPPSDAVVPETTLGPLGRFLMASGAMEISAERIDHDQELPVLPPTPAINESYGAYVIQTCVGCHRDTFVGGPMTLGDPSWPPAANLTPHAEGLKDWSRDQWLAFWKSGTRPDGTEVHPVAMPWKVLGQMGDVELEAVYVYLMSLEPQPTGT